MKLKQAIITGLTLAAFSVLTFISGCLPTEAPPEGEQGFDWTIIIFLVLIFALFYFLMIRPQRKRQKEHQQMTEELRVGDRIITIGGIYGRIESLARTAQS
jgi:preprotein translocase subunit YajC